MADPNTHMHVAHLRWRLRELQGLSAGQLEALVESRGRTRPPWPRWSVRDFIAVSALLGEGSD